MTGQTEESETHKNMSKSTKSTDGSDSEPVASGEIPKSDEFAEQSFTNEALAHVRVLDVGEPAREVARQLGLELQGALPEPGERPVVLVVSEPSEVDTLVDVENRAWIGCVVAWQLPEESVERLYQLGVSVLLGCQSSASCCMRSNIYQTQTKLSRHDHLRLVSQQSRSY